MPDAQPRDRVLDPPDDSVRAEALRARHIELLNQLEGIFFTEGYRAVTMDHLAKVLKCSKRALYEIAPSRKALFLLVVRRWTERIRRLGTQAALQHADPKARLAAFLEPGVRETAGMSEAFVADLHDYPEARAVLERHQQERMAGLRAIVDEGIAHGRFKSLHAQLVAGVCLAGMAKINEPAFLREAGLSFSEAFSELYHLLMTGLNSD